MNTTLLFVLLLVFLGSSVTAQNFGTDLSTYTLPTSFACLKNNGYYYTIIRAWKKDGTPDTNCPPTVANAWAGGMTNVDVYMFPCVSCGNPGQQVRDAVAYLASFNTVYTTFWLDVEGLDLWSTNLTANQEFLQGMINAGEQLGLKLGIYASKTMWTGIMGVNYPGGSQYPLWYPRYNNLTNYDDFVPFGGWTAPVMKQYLGTTAICGASVDFNWFPPSPSPSASPSTSVTPSKSPSRSPSSTPSTSSSPTPSRSPSRTPTPSRSPSRSPTPSRSPSRTPSPSASVTPTASASALPQPTFEPGVVSPFPIPSPLCQQCSGDGDCSGGQGICVTSSIGSYCACLSGFGGCECSESPAPQCSGSYAAVDTMSGNFQANATVDYQYPNLLITVEANLEESSWGNGDSDPGNPPPYSLETIIYFGSSPEAYPECSYPNGEATWQDQATDASCTDVWFSTMNWAFAKEHCGFAAVNGSRNYTQTITVLRRYNLNDVITRTEKTTRHLNVNFPEEVVIVDSNVTVNFPSANAFAGISSVDYDPATSLWTVIVQTSVNKPYALTFPVAALYSGNLGQRVPTVSVSGCTSVGSACVQTITYTYPQGGASDPCVGLFGTDLHTFALQCSTAACPAPNLLNITTTLNTGNACPIVDEIEFSEASLHSYSNAGVTNAKDTFSVIDVMYFGASVQSTEAMISSRTLKANSVCFLPPSGTCFYPEYTVLSSSNGKDPVFSVDFTAPGNAAYFGSITTPTAFQVKATVVVNFEGAKSLRRKKSVPQTQTVDTTTTALIGGSTSDSSYAAPSLLLLILAALLI